MFRLEMNNIKCKNEDIVKFYMYNPYQYEHDCRWSNERPEHPEKLYIKLEIKRSDGLWISWRELPYENAYQIYLDILETEYNNSLEEYQESYIDKILEKNEFIELTKLFSERS